MSTQGDPAASPRPDVAALANDAAMAGSWVLDASASRVEFSVRHFWGAVNVRGRFDQIAGAASVGPDGSVTGTLTMAAASVNTGNKQRDKHLRSADFFDAGRHAEVVVTVTEAKPDGQAELACRGTLEAAGRSRAIAFTARIGEAAAQAVVLDAEIVVDRTDWGMTWSPLKIAAPQARGTVTARFVRP